MYKLLIVDDEALEREALKCIIQKSDLKISKIQEAVNGKDAILVASEFNPDIVILDIKMPGLNGIEAGHILKNMKPELKIIFLTAYNSFEYAHEAIKIGVNEFIVKPGLDKKTIEIVQSCINELNNEIKEKDQTNEFFILLTRYLNIERQNNQKIPDFIFEDLKNMDTRGETKNYIHNYLFEIFDKMENEQNSKLLGFFDKVSEYIDNHYHDCIILEDVANEMGFSTYYFGKVFKKTFRLTFTEYLTNFRMEKAKYYLKNRNLTVKEVTYQVGYMDPNYFARVFKKYEGTTPTEYRSIVLS